MSSTDRNWALDLNNYGSFKGSECRKVRVKNGEEEIPSSLNTYVKNRKEYCKKSKTK